MFWNHSKQHSSKTKRTITHYTDGFGTIRNNTALKQPPVCKYHLQCFGTIRNNTALKHDVGEFYEWFGFGTIRNNTALKLVCLSSESLACFGTIRNNTALKPRGPFFLTKFRNRAICLSLTSAPNNSILNYFIPQTKGQFRVLLILVNLNRERC